MFGLTDKILTSAAFISLVEMGDAPAWIVVIIVAREFAISTLRSVSAESQVVIGGRCGYVLFYHFDYFLVV